MPATIDVIDGLAAHQTVNTLPALGTAADAASLPTAFSTEGKALLGALTETAPATDTASSGLNGRLQRVAQRLTSMIALLPTVLGQNAKANSLSVTIASDDAVSPYAATLTTTVTRPADTNIYAVNDCWSDSTSAPTAGGFTFTAAGRVSGGAGVIASATIVSSIDPATLLQGEIWIFDSAPTAVNDNAAFALSDADALKLVGVIPFTLASTQNGSGTNSFYHIGGLGIGYACVGSANLRFLVKVKNAYTPASAEALTVRLGVVGSN